MNKDNIAKLLKTGTVYFDIQLTDTAEEAFKAYGEYLSQENNNINLTALTDEADIAYLHFLDSLAPLAHFNLRNRRIIDIGSGAGFPGLPLKIAEPSIELTMLDATAKRVNFLERLCTILGTTDAVCLHQRAEEAAYNPNMRDSFDFALSRAVARLNVLCELCLPFVKPGGYFIAFKSVDTDAEISESLTAISSLGAEYIKSIDYEIPGAAVIHRLVVIRKKEITPKNYPRRFSKIQKQPL